MTSYTDLAEELFQLKTMEYEKGSKKRMDYASTGENGVLYQLYQSKDKRILAGDLARSMGLTSGRIANILKQLENKQYVVRVSGKNDRRQVNVTLTDKGKEHIEKVYRQNISDLKNQLEFLGEKDAEDYIRILRKLQHEEDHGTQGE